MTEKMQSLRKRLGTGNYRRISRDTGLSPQHVSRVLRGIKGASFQSAAAIADAAGVTLDELRAYIENEAGGYIPRAAA